MSILTRQIIRSAAISFAMSILLPSLVFFIYPLYDWSLLWNRKIMNFPFALFLPAASIILGVLYGTISGVYWKRQLAEVGDELYKISQGSASSFEGNTQVQEFARISVQFENVRRHIAEQAKSVQKLANEKVKDQEKYVQEIISQERNRLARELHDSVSQQLFAASMLMSAITESRQDTDSNEMKQLKLTESVIHQSQLEMRALLLHLRPVPLRDKSLQEGITSLLGELVQKVPMKITWKIEPVSMDRGIEDHLFRILQESVSNTLRHAKASSLEVSLISRDGLIIFIIADDGCGFRSENSKAGSYGLLNMQERAAEIGGTMKIVSVINKGTRLEVKVPLISSGGEDID
ncbi:sensor histidine kinase [Actinomycetes bacterium NPDC127524]